MSDDNLDKNDLFEAFLANTVEVFKEYTKFSSHYNFEFDDMIFALICGYSLAGIDAGESDMLNKVDPLIIQKAADYVKKHKNVKVTHTEFALNVLEAWHSEVDFTTVTLAPRQLPFSRSEAKSDDEITFTDLVEKHASGIEPESILDELVAASAAKTLDDGTVCALTRELMSHSREIGRLNESGALLRRIIGTATHNTTNSVENDRFFSRTVYTLKGLSPSVFAVFNDLVKNRAHDLLIQLDDFVQQNEVVGDDNIQTGISIVQFVE